jgi:YD repeat-containing protein
VPQSGSTFKVLGQHAYPEEDSYLFTATITDDGGASVMISGTATVSDAPPPSIVLHPTIIVEGQPVNAANGYIAYFSDPGGPEAPSNYSVTVNWGDGTTDTVTPVLLPAMVQVWGVPGSHTYAEEGSYLVTVTVVDDGNTPHPQNSGSGTMIYDVWDALLSCSGQFFSGTVGVPLNNLLVATFTDSDPGGTLTDYSATITWGDGTESSGTIQAGTGGAFNVLGSHTYTLPGSYTVVGVEVKDVGGGAATCATRASIAANPNVPTSSVGGDNTLVPVGEFNVGVNNGSLRADEALDFDQSPGTAVGGDPALDYNSATVSARPIVQALWPTNAALGVPTQIVATLTWDYGTAHQVVQPGIVFHTTGHSAGDTYLLAVQVASPVTQAGLHPYLLTLEADYAGSGPVTVTSSGTAAVVVADQANPLGAGWGIDGLDRLFPTSDGTGVLWASGAGDCRAFTGGSPGATTFTSTPGDFGTLVRNADGSFTYTAKDQTKEFFSAAGLLTRAVDTHGIALTYSYDGQSRLTGVAAPDGGLTTLAYDSTSGLLNTVSEPGGRTVTVLHDAAGNLTGVIDVDGSTRALAYDSGHRLTHDTWSPLSATAGYDATTGRLSSIDRGLGSVWHLTPEAVQGLQTSPAASGSRDVGVLTDPRGFASTYTLDHLGYQTKLQTPDGAVQAWERDGQEQVIVAVDGLGRPTVYTYQYGTGKGDLVEVDTPDGGVQTYAYEPTFHHLTSATNALGRRSAYTYAAVKYILRRLVVPAWGRSLTRAAV